MINGLIETEEELYSLLAKIKRACARVRPGAMLEEFTIIRRLSGPRPPLVQFIHGVMPEGYNPFADNSRATVKAIRQVKREINTE